MIKNYKYESVQKADIPRFSNEPAITLKEDIKIYYEDLINI